MGTDIGDIKKTVEFAYNLKPEDSGAPTLCPKGNETASGARIKRNLAVE